MARRRRASYRAPAYPYAGPAAHYGAARNKPIKRIVIHGTVSKCKPGMAQIIARYFRITDRYASAHYVVDPREVLQVVWDSFIAYHAPPNSNSLGIELCDEVEGKVERWAEEYHRRTLRKAARLTAELCLAYGIPTRKIGPIGLRLGRRGICGHDDVSKAWGQTDHWDPGAFPWDLFITMVKFEAEKIRREHGC